MESSNEFMDMVLNGSSAEEVSDKIKEILYTKSAQKIDEFRPYIAQSMMGTEEESEEN
jgi:hypothetical protein